MNLDKTTCKKARECPYCLAYPIPRKGWKLTCTGEWGRTCLIWKELDIMVHNYRIVSFKMSPMDWRRDENPIR